MSKFKNGCHKISSVLEKIVGIAFGVCLFAGALGFIGYMVALCIGGEQATALCTWIYKSYYPVLIKIGTIATLATFLMIYLKGDAKWVNPFKRRKDKGALQK